MTSFFIYFLIKIVLPVTHSLIYFLIFGSRFSSSIPFANIKSEDLQKSLSSVPSDIHIDLENWMGNLPDRLIHFPLIHLAIPGTHNSFSYSITKSSEVSPDSPNMVVSLGQQKCFGAVSKRFIYKWSKGQKLNVIEQLNAGIRFFDIRLVQNDNQIFVAHGMYACHICVYLDEINSFLQSHPKEVVILDFQHFYDFTLEYHERMRQMLCEIFGEKICTRNRKMIENTLCLFWQNRLQVLIIYRNSITATTNLYWPSSTWITDWPDEISMTKLLSYLDFSLGQKKKRGAGFVTQAILTVTPMYVALHPFATLKKLAGKLNKKTIDWLDRKCCGEDGVNVVICDYVDRSDFGKQVVLLNYKI